MLEISSFHAPPIIKYLLALHKLMFVVTYIAVWSFCYKLKECPVAFLITKWPRETLHRSALTGEAGDWGRTPFVRGTSAAKDCSCQYEPLVPGRLGLKAPRPCQAVSPLPLRLTNQDESRLPEGMQRVGYDASTQIYSYRDQDGSYWEGDPGARYGVLHQSK
jgi:hypothetical protein